MSAEENKALVRRAVEEIQNKGNVAVIDEVFASNYTFTALWPNPMRPASMPAGEGTSVLKAGVAMARAAMPDGRFTIDEMVAEGDTVITCATFRGTHTGGPFFDIPASGKTVHWTEFTIARIADGKIVEIRTLWDRLGAFQQLGIVPSQEELHPKR